MNSEAENPAVSSKKNKMGHQYRWPLLFLSVFFFLVLWSSSTPFFWDTLTQSSKWAHWYFEHTFHQLLLPPELDAGHPPLFAIYLAAIWTFFGKSLWISHLAVLPFVLGIVWQVIQLVRYFFPSTAHHFWILLLVLSDATLLAQCSLVSPDLVLTFGCLLALNGVLQERRGALMIGSLLAAMVSLRGIFLMAAFVLFLIICYLLDHRANRWRHLRTRLLNLLPAVLFLILYYTWHYNQTGWWISTPEEAWSGHRSFVGLKEVIRNTAVLGWRLLDFGRIGIWLALLFVGFGLGRLWWQQELKVRLLLGFIFSFLLAFAPAFLLISNPVAHRYLLPLYLVIAVLAAYLLVAKYGKSSALKWGMAILVLIQLSGHFWIYPRKIAQGWDASLAYRPYFELRAQMITYLDKGGIDWKEVGTEFPNIGPASLIDLSEEQREFEKKNFDQHRYIFYSNVYNDFSDDELDQLEEEWREERRFEKGGIEVVLYRK